MRDPVRSKRQAADWKIVMKQVSDNSSKIYKELSKLNGENTMQLENGQKYEGIFH